MKEEILRLRSEGRSYRQIVDELGCSKGTVAYHCGVGQKEKSNQRMKDKRNQKIKYIQQYKQERGCMDCGENYPYWILELDHARGVKVSNLSKMVATHNMTDILIEIEKCDVVCANCHRIRTWQRIQKTGNSNMDLEEFYL